MCIVWLEFASIYPHVLVALEIQNKPDHSREAWRGKESSGMVLMMSLDRKRLLLSCKFSKTCSYRYLRKGSSSRPDNLTVSTRKFGVYITICLPGFSCPTCYQYLALV